MRALSPFSWLSRWLDLRIDARIAAAEQRSADRLADNFRNIREARAANAVAARLPGHERLAEEASSDIRAATAIASRLSGVRQSPSSAQEEG